MLEHGAIGDVAGHPRLAVADDAAADLRPHAVAADQGAALGALPTSKRDADVVAVIFIALDLAAVLQRDQIAALTGAQEHAVDVGAMRHSIRLLESLYGVIAERHPGDQFSGQCIAHFHSGRYMGIGQHCVLESDAF